MLLFYVFTITVNLSLLLKEQGLYKCIHIVFQQTRTSAASEILIQEQGMRWLACMSAHYKCNTMRNNVYKGHYLLYIYEWPLIIELTCDMLLKPLTGWRALFSWTQSRRVAGKSNLRQHQLRQRRWEQSQRSFCI